MRLFWTPVVMAALALPVVMQQPGPTVVAAVFGLVVAELYEIAEQRVRTWRKGRVT